MKYKNGWSMLVLSILFSIFGCKNSDPSDEKNANSKFDWVEFNNISSDDLKILDQGNNVFIDQGGIDQTIHLSELISDFHYLQLKNDQGHLLGDIDKILFTDSLIFVMDQYITNTLQIFERSSGHELAYLKKSGEGPKEFLEIYDFDIDRDKNQLLLFDGKLSKMLVFDFSGKFVEEFKIPIRAQNFRKVSSDEYIFYSANLPNSHFEVGNECKYFILDATFKVLSCFSIDQKLETYGHYFSRDYFSSDGVSTYLFPRFGNDFFKLNVKEEELIKKASIDLEGSIEIQDLVSDGLSFVENRKADMKFFSHGGSFVTNQVFGLEFRRFGGNNFYYFERVEPKDQFYGTKLDFDIPGMPLFSFPISSFGDESISVIQLQQLRSIGIENFKTKLKKLNMLTDQFAEFLDSIEDFDQPAIMIMEFK